MGQSLAVKYRPHEFKDVLGQSAVIRILSKQLQANKISNCYLFCGPSGDGKAQPLTSKILTKNGYITMGDVKVGDLIIDGLGKETKVLNVFPQGKRDIYKIRFSDNTFIEVADNHINRVYRHNTDTDEFEILDLTTLELIKYMQSKAYKDRFNLYVPTPEINCWEESPVAINPYLLGCILGDGSISKKNCGFSTIDKEMVDRISHILKSDFDLTLRKVTNCDYRIKKDSTQYLLKYRNKFYFTLRALRDKLRQDGFEIKDTRTVLKIAEGTAKTSLKKYPELNGAIQIISKKLSENKLKKLLTELNLNMTSDNKFIPDQYLYNSKAIRLAILQGLMDTDGTVNKPKISEFTGNKIYGRCSFTTTNQILAKQVAYLIRSLGGLATETESKNNTYTYQYNGKEETRSCKPSYTIYAKMADDSELFRLTRKKSIAGTHRFNPQRKITSIEFDRVDNCQCIYVESEDHTYITDNETVTHNTTIARILANYINQNKGSIIEIDGASNNGVDAVRSIIESAKERSIDSEYKVFLIDECHMITSAGWNAFLKCIEEPPEYTIFMFCTTNPEKIPATILNRVMRFNLTKVDTELITQRLMFICDQEGFINYNEACDFISKLSSGGVRDAIATLEKCSNYSTDLNIDNILACLGDFSFDSLFNLTGSLLNKDCGQVLNQINAYYNSGSDLKLFVERYLDFVLDLTKYYIFKDMKMVKIPSSLKDRLDGYAKIPGIYEYNVKLVEKILEIKNAIKYDTNIKTTIEAMFLAIARGIQP